MMLWVTIAAVLAGAPAKAPKPFTLDSEGVLHVQPKTKVRFVFSPTKDESPKTPSHEVVRARPSSKADDEGASTGLGKVLVAVRHSARCYATIAMLAQVTDRPASEVVAGLIDEGKGLRFNQDGLADDITADRGRASADTDAVKNLAVERETDAKGKNVATVLVGEYVDAAYYLDDPTIEALELLSKQNALTPDQTLDELVIHHLNAAMVPLFKKQR